MGRKKRKVASEGEAAADDETQGLQDPLVARTPSSSLPAAIATASTNHENAVEASVTVSKAEAASSSTKATSSNYAVTSHSGEIIQEDIYVSDGSDDDDDYAEIALAGSRMGIMRRGLHAPQALQQPNRQWTRATDGDKNKDGSGSGSGSIKPKLNEQEELEQMDPAARAARLALEKQRREQEAILEARREENEANVLQSPALFSKRTAFDIRFDQIEEKPWERNLAPGEQASTEQLSEYFNYGLSEEDWLEYSQQQLLIRQELIDASRQKRPPDPNIVPVQPRKKEENEINSNAAGVEAKPQVETSEGEAVQQTAEDTAMAQSPFTEGTQNKTGNSFNLDDPQQVADTMAPQKLEASTVKVVADLGGAWGAGATPGSVLARLMEEQEQLQQQQLAQQQPPQPQQQPQLQQQHERGSTTNTQSSATRRDSLGGATTSSYGGSHADTSERYTSHTDDSHNPYYNNSRYVAQPPPPPPGEDYRSRGGRGWQQPPQQAPIAPDSYYPPQQRQPYPGGRGRGTFRGGGRGEGFRSYQAPPGGAGGYDPRKRPREDPRWTRNGPR